MSTHFNSYTYLLTRLSDGMKYHGLRTANNCEPSDDFGVVYFSSGNMAKEFRANPEGFTWTLTEHGTKKEARLEEERYHAEFNVAFDKGYANKRNANGAFNSVFTPDVFIDAMVAAGIADEFIQNLKEAADSGDMRIWNKAYKLAYNLANKEKRAAYNLANKEKKAAQQKAYELANKEKIAANNKAYSQINKEKLAAYYQAYSQINKEKLAAYKLAYNLANKEKRAANNKAYNLANKEKLAAQHKACYLANKEKRAAYKLAYSLANKEKLAAQRRARRAASRPE